MLYIRKTLTKREKAEYREWLRKHQSTSAPRLQQDYWAQKAKEQRQLDSLRVSTAHIPSLPPQPLVPPKNPMSDMDADERQRYLLREEAARRETLEKMARTAPAYNKGPSVFWTDEMAKDISSGGHRRR